VNEAFAHKFLPGENPLGQRLLNGGSQSTIVGVAGNVRGSALGAEPTPLIYECYCETDGDYGRMGFVIRTTGDPRAAIRAVEGQVYAVARHQPVFDVKTMDERLAESLAPQRFHLVLIGTFAAIALVLSALGVYGVLSHLVTRRTREIGIRIAMGAQAGEVRRLVVGESVAQGLGARGG
jgi:ABC-type antimicrobial peptide transport system permease subunit